MGERCILTGGGRKVPQMQPHWPEHIRSRKEILATLPSRQHMRGPALTAWIIKSWQTSIIKSKDNFVDAKSPPDDGPYASDPNYIKVKIQVDTQTSLIHFVFNGLARNQVEATARAFPSQPIVPGMALVALDDIPHDCDAMTFHGGGGKQIAVTVTGGGIYSNSPDAPPPSSCYSGIREGTIDLNVTEGGINVVGEWGVKGNSGTQVPVNATEGVTPVSVPPVPVPVCPTTSSGEIKVTNGKTETKGPGLYDSIDVQGGVLTLTEGLYCITGDVKTNGGTIFRILVMGLCFT